MALTPRHRARISKALKGRTQTDEHKQKLWAGYRAFVERKEAEKQEPQRIIERSLAEEEEWVRSQDAVLDITVDEEQQALAVAHRLGFTS